MWNWFWENSHLKSKIGIFKSIKNKINLMILSQCYFKLSRKLVLNEMCNFYLFSLFSKISIICLFNFSVFLFYREEVRRSDDQMTFILNPPSLYWCSISLHLLIYPSPFFKITCWNMVTSLPVNLNKTFSNYLEISSLAVF